MRVASGAERDARSAALAEKRSSIVGNGTAPGSGPKSPGLVTLDRVNASALGSVALWGAVSAGAASVVPLFDRRIRLAALRASAALAVLSTVTLVTALIVGDFSIAYVVETTSRATPWPYRLAAVWGGMEGSMLFYATLTLAVSALAAGRLDRSGISGSIVGLVGTGYLLVAGLAANPFATLEVPAVDGQGLLAILQHPAMVYHPPILYMGLTSLVVPFAVTISSLWRGGLDRTWVKLTRRWLFVSWTLLTLGMVAGANWAYVELGWGGFWAWDPVENTALMPWLAATVFIHTSRIYERDGRLSRWNAFFALLPFTLSVLGVYLTRSGVTGSIHSFAEDPVIGRALLTAALVVLVASLAAVLQAQSGRRWERLGLGRDTWLAASGGLIAAALVFVTIGTAYPAYASVFFDEAVTVDSRFFVTTLYPIAIVVGVLTAFALDTRWSGSGITDRHAGLWLAGSVAIGVVGVALGGSLVPIVLLAVSGGGVLVVGYRILAARGRKVAAHLGHLGLLMILIGAGGSALGEEFSGVMSLGDTVEVGDTRVSLIDLETGDHERYIFARARFEVDSTTSLAPEIRAYEDQPQPISEPDLHSTPLRDVIVAISRLSPDRETVNVSVFVRPMVWWVWAGALMVASAGAVRLLGRSGGASKRRPKARAGRQSGETTSDTSAR